MTSWFGPTVPVRITATGAITTGAGVVRAFSLVGGTAAFSIFDNASAASGTVVAEGTAVAGGLMVQLPAEGVSFSNGLYITFGTGLTSIIAYITK